MSNGDCYWKDDCRFKHPLSFLGQAHTSPGRTMTPKSQTNPLNPITTYGWIPPMNRNGAVGAPVMSVGQSSILGKVGENHHGQQWQITQATGQQYTMQEPQQYQQQQPLLLTEQQWRERQQNAALKPPKNQQPWTGQFQGTRRF